MEKYYKNFILCGEVDYYCILCEETFNHEVDVAKHIRWEKHRNELKLQEYLHKYKKDFIYKKNNLYYCEVCNLVTTDVAGHIKEDTHETKKANSMRTSKKQSVVKCELNGTIEANDKTVSKIQWQSEKFITKCHKDRKCLLDNLDNKNVASCDIKSNLTQNSVECECDKCNQEKNVLYYCEVCDVATTDGAGHIKEDAHQTKKANSSKKPSLVKREADGTIKVNNKTVSRLQWHGIQKCKCLLCNLDNINKLDHVISPSHMSNLTQSSVKCVGYNCYRELRFGKFYCFTCFETFDNEHLVNHYTVKHNGKDKGRKNHCKTKKGESKRDSNNNANDTILKFLADTYNGKYKVDVEKNTAECLLCNASVTPRIHEIQKHTRLFHPEEITYVVTQDHGKRRHDLAIYASENYLKLNEGGSKMFCNLCTIFMSAHMNCATQHVQGALHRGHLEILGLTKVRKHEKPPIKAVAFETYLKEKYGPYQIADYRVIIMNDGICIEVLSYGLIKIIDTFGGHKAKCYACNLTLSFFEVLKHSQENEHMNIVLKCKVLNLERDGKTDFIREIHPGLYHCGCCNKVYPFWENMAKHLKTFTHKVQRSKKTLLSIISAHLFMNPHLDLDDIEEYKKLRRLDEIN